MAESVANQAIEIIDINKYEQILAESSETEYYYQLRDQLNQLRESTGLDYLYTMMRDQKNGDYQYFYVVDGMPIGDEEESPLGTVEEDITSFPKIIDAFKTKTSQSELSYSEEWGASLSAYVPIKSESGHVIGIMGADLNADEIFQAMKVNKIKLTVFTIITLLISFIFIFFFSNLLLTPLQKITDHMHLIGEGKLSEKVNIQRDDEIGHLANSINKMQHNLESIILNISRFAESVSSQSEELTQTSNEVKEGSMQVSTTMLDLSSGFDKQVESSALIANEMITFIEKIEKVNERGENISNQTKDIHNLAIEGNQLMQNSVLHMDRITEIVSNSVNKVKGLNKKSLEISNLIDVIKGIADQTNLLALNAAIEAARAGEQGKGFAVVADEVRKLAEQVKLSVIDITEIILNIQSEANDTVYSLENGFKQVEEGTNQIHITGKAFRNINNSVSIMVENVSAITKNLKEVKENSLLMNSSIKEIEKISSEAGTEVKNITVSIYQTNTSMQEISNSANELAELAEKLFYQIKQFQINSIPETNKENSTSKNINL